MIDRIGRALGPALTLLAMPAAAHAAEAQVSAADSVGHVAALIVLLLGAVVAGYFFVRPFARRGDRMALQLPRSDPPSGAETAPRSDASDAVPPAGHAAGAAEARASRRPWSTERLGRPW